MAEPLGLVSLVGFTLAATASPGGATMLVTASGMRFGFGRSVPLMSGICLGLGALVATIAAGLGEVFQTFPALAIGLRWAGTLYVLYLAWAVARQGVPDGADETARPLGPLRGALVAVVNPKVWILGTTATTLFSDIAPTTLGVAVLLGGAFVLIGALSASFWCLLGARLAGLLSTARQWHIVNATFACLLVGSIVPVWLR